MAVGEAAQQRTTRKRWPFLNARLCSSASLSTGPHDSM